MSEKVYLDENGDPIPAGRLTTGNIDLHNRPVVKNQDGSISTVRSIGVNIDGKEVLIPTVSNDGRVLSNDDAIKEYRRTGKHLGIFDSPDHSTAFAKTLHESQANEYGGGAKTYLDDQGNPIGGDSKHQPQGDMGRFAGYKRLGDSVIGAIKGAARHPIETGALIGGAVAAPFTGGASIPAGMAAAGLGGVGGAGLGMLYNALFGQEDSPTTTGGVIARMGTEGATQAAAEGGGRIVAKGLRMVGEQAYRGALRPSAAIRAKTPNVVRQGIDDGLIVGPESSAGKAKELMRDSRAEADTLRSAAQAAGSGPVPRAEVRGPLMDMARDAKRAATLTGIPDDSGAIVERARALQTSYPLDDAHEAARIMNDRADAAFRAEQRGGTPRGVNANIDQTLARAFSDSVKNRVPGLAEVNQTTSTRFGLAKALKAAAERPSVLANIMAGSTGVGTFAQTHDPEKALASFLAVKGLSSPRTLSAGGIALDRAGKAPIANFFRTALLTKLLGEDAK